MKELCLVRLMVKNNLCLETTCTPASKALHITSFADVRDSIRLTSEA